MEKDINKETVVEENKNETLKKKSSKTRMILVLAFLFLFTLVS